MKRDARSYKLAALRDSGTLNPRQHLVRACIFQAGDFFDPHDLLQVKYEMLRAVAREGVSVTNSARLFGFSRMGWYQIKARYEMLGVYGLLPQRRGPQKQPRPWVRLTLSKCCVFVRNMSC